MNHSHSVTAPPPHLHHPTLPTAPLHRHHHGHHRHDHQNRTTSFAPRDVHAGNLGDLESLRQLEEVSLWSTGTTGSVACFAKLGKLRECYLGGCFGIKGDVAAAFGALPSLRVLDVAGTQCSGKISARGGELKVWAADARSVVVGS